jgi:hypothetical protein
MQVLSTGLFGDCEIGNPAFEEVKFDGKVFYKIG